MDVMPEFLDLHGRSSKSLRALVDKAVRRHGLRFGQDLLLAALWERDGRTPGEVADALSVTTPTIVTMADRMTATGLLTRRRDEHDNRLVRLWLTDQGRELRRPIQAERTRIERQVTAGLSDAEKTELVRLLKIVQESASEARLEGGR
jgi:MarR family transcriptional regulator, organic hydroperoxide resistance regulator